MLFIPRKLVLPGIALAFTVVSATRYCECLSEVDNNRQIVFDGINNVCSEMPNEYCSTNCDVLGWKCRYCQYKPAGKLPVDGYNQIRHWCIQQRQPKNYWPWKGTHLTCYTRPNINECGSCRGCSYYNNDRVEEAKQHGTPSTDWASQTEDLRPYASSIGLGHLYDDGDDEGDPTKPDPDNSTATLVFNDIDTNICSLLQSLVANDLVNFVSQEFSSCTAKNLTESSGVAVAACQDVTKQPSVAAYFEQMCNLAGGHHGEANPGDTDRPVVRIFQSELNQQKLDMDL